MTKYFIASDVHSFFTIMHNELIKKGFDINNKDHKLVICGDLFDRGDETKQLYEFVRSLGDRFIYIRGNHEDLLRDCVFDIVTGNSIGEHHFHNKTVRTIAQFCDVGEDEFYYTRLSDSLKQTVKEKMKLILDWIEEKSVDYCSIGDYILVHGWVPIAYEKINPNPFENKTLADPKEWRTNRYVWETARWINGMKAWKEGNRIEGKTIICGHWHCSWGHSHIHQDREEFPQKDRKNWEKSFEPFVDDGIIAIDACTAYSGVCNVITLEVEDRFLKAM